MLAEVLAMTKQLAKLAKVDGGFESLRTASPGRSYDELVSESGHSQCTDAESADFLPAQSRATSW
jgi:hypothetical protein